MCAVIAHVQPEDAIIVDESLTSGGAYWDLSKVCPCTHVLCLPGSITSALFQPAFFASVQASMLTVQQFKQARHVRDTYSPESPCTFMLCWTSIWNGSLRLCACIGCELAVQLPSRHYNPMLSSFVWPENVSKLQGCPRFSHLTLAGGAIGSGPPLAQRSWQHGLTKLSH